MLLEGWKQHSPYSFSLPSEGKRRAGPHQHLRTFALDMKKNEASFALSCGKRWIGYSEKRVRLQTFSIRFLFSEVWKSEGTCSLGLEKASFKNRHHHTANMLNTGVSIHVLDELGFCLCTLPSTDLHHGF